MIHCAGEILFGNRITMLTPGELTLLFGICQSNCADHVPEVPLVPHVPQN
jgi:hypothetical protein